MWSEVFIFVYYIFLQNIVNATDVISESEFLKENAIKLNSYVYWPNGTIPFYIEENHFDADQKTEIEKTLSLFAQKTCLKFLPMLTTPTVDQHVLVFENPGGVKKCVVNTDGHPRNSPHKVMLGYNCLKSPHIEMIIMRALGFSFEHNRASRDLFIDVQLQNIDMAFMELFTKDNKLPPELQALPYDVNSVLHFGERDYSKNSHRTIIFKDHTIKQNRVGLSPLDLRKIEIVYGPECRRRNRQEQIELCQTFPGISRKKRELEPEQKNLRVNPDITPPPEVLNLNTEEKNTTNVDHVLEELGIVNEVQQVVDQVYKVSSLALKNARLKYCNNSKLDLRTAPELDAKKNNDILGVIEMVANFAKSMVDNALSNLTTFCMESDTIETYQMARCSFGGSYRCTGNKDYKSTKFGQVWHSTQHRPTIRQSTKHKGIFDKQYQGHKGYYRSRNDSGETVTEIEKDGNVTTITTKALRRKREVNYEIFRNKRRVELKDNITNENVSVVEDITEDVTPNDTALNSSKDHLSTVTNVYQNDGRRKFQAHRYSEKHRDQSTERKWDNSNLSIEAKSITGISDSNERENKDENEENIIKAKNYNKRFTQSNKYQEDENKETPISRHVMRHKNKWIEKERKRYNINKKINIYSDDNEESLEEKREVKKYTKKPSRYNKEENFEERREVKDNRELPEKGNKQVNKYKKRPGRDSQIESSEEKREIKEYKQIPNRPKRISEESTSPRLKTVRLSKINQEFYNERQWPEGVVPYYIKQDPNYDTEDIRRRLNEVNRILLQKTCVKIQELKKKELAQLEDYLILDTSADFVTGRVGGKQNFGCLELFQGGQHRQHAAMVVMAMLGFYFELARHDRDKYVKVHFRHIRPDKLHHFEKIREDATLALPYDYKSATHPAWQFWRKLGKTGISSVATYKNLDPDGSIMKSLGQNEQLLSDLDIIKINSVYGTQCFSTKNREN